MSARLGAGLTFLDWMQQTQASTESALDAMLPQVTEVPSVLHEAMRYTALDGGKRIRPLLVFAAGDLVQCPGLACCSGLRPQLNDSRLFAGA